MRFARWYAALAALVLVGGATSVFLFASSIRPPRVLDRRCRGGCLAPTLSILPDGVPSSQVAAGFLQTATGTPVTITRASNKTCTQAAGTLTTLVNNIPCLETPGWLVEGDATNLLLRSGAIGSAAPWASVSSGAGLDPTVTLNSCTAPDGTLTGTKLDFPAVSGAAAYSLMTQLFTATAVKHTLSVYVKLATAGNATTYLSTTPDGTTYSNTTITLTNSWQRVTLTRTMTAAGWYFQLGTDLRNGGAGGQSATGAVSVCAWGAQGEAFAYATSYVPTVGSTATRVSEQGRVTIPASGQQGCVSLVATPWFSGPDPGGYYGFQLLIPASITGLYEPGDSNFASFIGGQYTTAPGGTFAVNVPRRYLTRWTATTSTTCDVTASRCASQTFASHLTGSVAAQVGASPGGATTSMWLREIRYNTYPSGCL